MRLSASAGGHDIPMTTLEIVAGGGALVALWVVLLLASWLEDLLGPRQAHTDAPVAPGPSALPAPRAAPLIAAERAVDAA